MGKVRIYELAKEADMASKVLADKLIDLGYNIKGHSSTVDEDVANEIRRAVLGTATTEVEEKRISGKGGATVIRRRSRTVIQPASVETAAVDEPSEEKPVLEEVVAREKSAPESKKTADTEITTSEEAEQEKVEESEAVEGEPVVAAAALPPVSAVEVEAAPAPPVAEEAEKEVVEGQDALPGEEKTKTVPKPKTRKGLAKVIKKAAIQIEEEVKQRPVKYGKALRVKEQTLADDIGLVGDHVPRDVEDAAGKIVGKGKKKGKRLVQIEQNEMPRKVFPGKKKGKRVVDLADAEYEERLFRRGRGKAPRKKEVEPPPPPAETKAIKKRIKVYETISVGDIAHRMGVKANQVIAKLMGLGVMATLNQALDVDTATLIAADFGYEIEQGLTEELHVINLEEMEGGGEPLPRPPVVTVMGHVDHGKTSILDAIRKTDVAAGEAGGITQHIGAYYVRSAAGDVVFLDTPGHAAFTEMRSRGAQVTDVVVLVVAADDGVMEQTKEAVNHARAAEVPIVVAVNKIDKANANPDRVKRELAELGLVPEEWGGDVIFCETSAKQNLGIEELLNNIQLQAEVLELKADPKRKARGRVIEAQLHKGRGAVATVLVQEGTLHQGDPVVVGQFAGKVRSLINDKGEVVQSASPATPVEVQGLSGVPQAGDEFFVVPDEKTAKNVSASRQLKARETVLAASNKISLDKLFERMQMGEVKELRVVLRADVQGTLEAFGKAIEKLSTDVIKVVSLHEGTGTISESDVLLASASDAIIIGFNVRPSVKVKDLAEKEKVDIRSYDVIYHALDDIRKAMTGLLDPTYEEKVIGAAEVRDLFHVPKIGTVAGCYVIDGKVERNAQLRVVRDGVVVYTGKIGSLRRFKEDAREVVSGYECGVGVENFNDVKIGDILEAFVMEEVASTL